MGIYGECAKSILQKTIARYYPSKQYRIQYFYSERPALFITFSNSSKIEGSS